MKTGASLTLICIGAILAFAVNGHPSFFNVNTAGWVLMIIGVIGLLLPGRTAGWLGRRLMVRRTYPGGRVERIPVQPYVARNPRVSALEAGIPSRPTLIDDPDNDLIEEAGAPAYQPRTARPPAATEVIEDLYEQP